MPINPPMIKLCVGKPKAHHMPEMFSFMQAAYRKSLGDHGRMVAQALSLNPLADFQPLKDVYRQLRRSTNYAAEPPCQDAPQTLQESWQRQLESGHFGDCEDYTIAVSAIRTIGGRDPGHWVYIGNAEDPWMHVVNGFWVNGGWLLLDATAAHGFPWDVPAGLSITNIVSPTGEWPGQTFPLFTQHMQTVATRGTAGASMKAATVSPTASLDTRDLNPPSLDPPTIDCPCVNLTASLGIAPSPVDVQGVGILPILAVVGYIALGASVGAGTYAVIDTITEDSDEEVVTRAARQLAEDAAEQQKVYADDTSLDSQFPVPRVPRESPRATGPFGNLSDLFALASEARDAVDPKLWLPAPLNGPVPGAFAPVFIAMLADLERQHRYAQQALTWMQAAPRDDFNLNPRASTSRITYTRWIINNLISMADNATHWLDNYLARSEAVMPTLINQVAEEQDQQVREQAVRDLIIGTKADYFALGALSGYIKAMYLAAPGLERELSAISHTQEAFVGSAEKLADKVIDEIQKNKDSWLTQLQNMLSKAGTFGLLAAGAVVAGMLIASRRRD